MKKNLYALLLLFCIGFNANSQTILSESFEGTFPPTGWTIVNAGLGNTWTQNTIATYVNNGTKSMTYSYNEFANANAWAFTPSLPLNSAKAYYVSFFVRARSASFPENLKFTVGNAATVAAQTTTLLDTSNIVNVTFRKWTAYYVPTASGNFNFAFNCYSLADQYDLFVDSVTIFEGAPIAACSGTPTGGAATASATTVCAAGNVNLGVSGASTAPGLTYKWQSSPVGANTWTDIPSATNATYTAAVTASTDYRRVTICSNGGASANSSSVTVTLSGPPSNDLICNAIALTLNGPQNCGNTTCATATGDPTFVNSTPNNTVWYTYTPSAAGTISFKFKRPAGVTSGLLYGWVGIYTSAGGCTGILTEVTSNISYDLTTLDSVIVLSPALTAGTTYYLMVDGFSGAFGAYCISLITPPTPPTCSTLLLPTNGTTTADNLFTLTWTKATNAVSYDVYINTTTPPTLFTNVVDTTLALSSNVGGTSFYWYVVPRGIGGAATGCDATIFQFTTRSTPANDSCGAAIQLLGGVVTNGALTGATTSPVASVICGASTYASAADVWYKIIANSNGTATVSVSGNFGTGFNPVLAAYSGTCSAPTLISCSDASATTTETLSLTGLVAGNTYLIRVFANGTIANGGFTISAAGPALPVTGMVLTGNRNGSKAQLGWQTFTETNNAGFELQRSADGRSFTSIATIASKANGGNSSSGFTYSVDDTKPFSGANYYRIKQIDKDGRFNFSNVVYLKGNAVTNLVLSAVYPNPTTDVLKASIQAPTAETITFVVSDMTGKVIRRQVSSVTTGDNVISFDVAALPTGSYLLKAICRNGCETAYQKFTKQ